MAVDHELLSSIPVQVVSFEQDEKNFVYLLNLKSRNRLIRKLLDLFRAGQFFRVKLDRLGSYCWLLADGKKTVAEIASELRREFAEQAESAEERTALFFYQLYRNKQIKFLKKGE